MRAQLTVSVLEEVDWMWGGAGLSRPRPLSSCPVARRLTVAELAQFLSNENAGVPRLGVPKLSYGEALHGYVHGCISNPAPGTTGCPTSFPHALLMGGAFNRSLWRAVAGIISTEGRAVFNAVNRTSREPMWRWGVCVWCPVSPHPPPRTRRCHHVGPRHQPVSRPTLGTRPGVRRRALMLIHGVDPNLHPRPQSRR